MCGCWIPVLSPAYLFHGAWVETSAFVEVIPGYQLYTSCITNVLVSPHLVGNLNLHGTYWVSLHHGTYSRPLVGSIRWHGGSIANTVAQSVQKIRTIKLGKVCFSVTQMLSKSSLDPQL